VIVSCFTTQRAERQVSDKRLESR